MAKMKTAAVTFIAILLLLSFGGGIVYLTMYTHNLPPVAGSIAAAPASTTASLQPAPRTPNATLAALVNAVGSGDADALVGSFEPLSAEQEAAVRQAARGMAAAAKLRSDVTNQFGDEAGVRLLQWLNIYPSPEMITAMTEISPTYDGNAAQMDLPKIGLLEFVKVGETWKVRGAMLQSGLSFFSQFASNLPALTEVDSQVNAGRYRDVQEVHDALETAFATMGDDPAGGPPDRPAVLGPGTTPMQTIAALVWAQTTGNQEAAITCLVNPSADEQAGLRVQTELFCAGEQIRSAIAPKFGPKVARISILTLGLDSGLSKQSLDSTRRLADISSADRVQIDLATIGLKMSLAKSGGVWRIEPASLGFGSNPKWGARLHEHYLPKYLQLASDIKAGTYLNAGELQVAVDALHQELVADQKQYFAGN